MSILRRLGALLTGWASTTAQRLISVVRGKAIHIILTGPDGVGMEHLVVELASLQPIRTSALSTKRKNQRLIVSADLDDIIRADQVPQALHASRQIVVVSATADPRDMVCRKDDRLPHQWPDNFDYRFHFGPDGLKSLTEPGVLARLDGLNRWVESAWVQVIRVSREELASDTSAVLMRIAEVLRGRGAARARTLLHGSAAVAQPLVAPPSFLDSADHRKRVADQIALAPELEQRALKLGYSAFSSPKTSVKGSSRGTVIAFHTPDEVYRAEAARFRSTLEALGLEYRFFEVSPEKNWVRTTLLKPSWILKAREEMSGPLLYVDVDAFVHHDPWPSLSGLEGDMGAVVYRNGQLNSATLWINDTDNAREILERWKERADSRRADDHGDLEPTGDNGDQGVLKQVVLADEQSDSPRFRFLRLPVNVAFIFDRPETYLVGDVVIEQLQASRESIGHDKRLARRRARLEQLQASAPAPGP